MSGFNKIKSARKILSLYVMSAVFFSVPHFANAGEFLSVRDLKNMCDAISPIEKARCDGVMLGLFDGLGASVAGSPPINQSLFCTPKAATSKQISAIMRQAVLNRPEILHLNAREGFIHVMRGAFPCGSAGNTFSAPSSSFPKPFRDIAPASPTAGSKMNDLSPNVPPPSAPPPPVVKNPFGSPTPVAPKDFNPTLIEEESNSGQSVFTLREDER